MPKATVTIDGVTHTMPDGRPFQTITEREAAIAILVSMIDELGFAKLELMPHNGPAAQEATIDMGISALKVLGFTSDEIIQGYADQERIRLEKQRERSLTAEQQRLIDEIFRMAGGQ